MIEEIRELQQALKSDPSNRNAFDALADQYAADGDWRRLRWHYEKFSDHLDAESDFSQLVYVLRELAEAEEKPREKSAILVALGDMLFEHLDNHDEGMAAYQTAFRTYPEDTVSLDRARRIYRELGQFKRVLLLYDLECGVKKGTPAINDVLVRIAQVHGEFLGDRDEAMSALARVLEDDSDHEIARLIQQIYEAGGSVETAVKDKVREGHQAAQAEQMSHAAELLLQAAKLERFREGGGAREAVELAEKARSFDADHLEARAFLSELYEELEQEDALHQLSETSEAVDEPEAGQTDADVDAPAEDADELPTLDESSLAADGGQPAPIVEQYQAADDFESAQKQLAEDPADLDALSVVREHLRGEGALDELAEQLTQSVKYLRKKDGELTIMVELANLYWHELGDPEKAEYYFKRIKLLDAEQPDMLSFYEDFYQRGGDWRKLFSLLSSRQNEATDEEDALALTARLAQIAEVQMESPEKAIDVWRQFEREHTGHPQAREQLRRLYEENGKWNALVDFFKERVRALEEVAEQSGDDNRGARVLLLERISEIYRDELGLDTMVINTLSSILELEPDHLPAFEELKEKLAEGRRWNDLAGLLFERAELMLAQDHEFEAVELYLQVADIWQESLRNVTQALPHLERVLEIQPDNAPVRERLADIYEQRRDYESLFDLKFSEAPRVAVSEREALLETLLSLAEDRLRDPERMVQVLNQLRELRPDDAELLGKLEFIYRRVDDFVGLADVLEAKAALAEKGADNDENQNTRLAALREAARLRESQNDDPQGAARIWQGLLAENADDQEALGRLTDIYIQSQDFDAIQALYASRDELGELCQLLTVAAEADADPARKRAIYRRVADIAADPIGDRVLAVASLNSLKELLDDPRDVARELIAHFKAMENLDGQINATRLLLEHAEDDAARFEWLEALGDLERKNDDAAAALEWFLQAATLQPGADSVLAEAEEIARQSDSMGLFVEHLELIADEADAPGADKYDAEICARLWRRLGRVLRDDQQNYASAIDYFERLREQDPTDIKTLNALEALYERTEQPEKRIEVLRDAIDVLTGEGAARVDLVDELSKIADVQRTHLGEPDAARSTYIEILDLAPDHVGALRGIRGLHRADGQWDEVVDSLQREIGLLPLDQIDARVAAQMELADTLRLELGDLREAIHCYGQVLAEEPQHEGAVEAVEALLSEPSLARDAALMLEPIFRDTDSHPQLARALEARRAVCDDRFEEAEILDELIPIYHEQLDQTEQAFEHACRQFELDPGREDIWLRVEQLGAALNRWADIEQIFSKYVPDEDSSSGIIPDINLLRHLAAIREYQLRKPEEALAAWQRVYEAEPTDDSVIDALERLYRQLGREQKLIEILEVRETLSDNDEARIDVLLEIAQLSDTVLEDPARTIDAYRRVLLLEADHAQAVDELARLYRATEAWFDLDELYVSQADLAMDPDRRRAFLLNLGNLRAEHLSDFAGAADILSQLVREDPGDLDAVDALESLDQTLQNADDDDPLRLDIARTLEPVYRSLEAHEKLAGVLEIRQSHTLEPFEKVALLDELVGLYLTHIDDPSAGLDALKRAVLADPDDEGRRVRLLEICADQDRLEEAAQTLEDAAVEADALSIGPIYRQLGSLYEDHLLQSEPAIDAFERALAQDESDEDSMRALERLYQATSKTERLAENLRQQVRFADSARRVELLARAATLYEDVLERPDDAIATYHDLLDEQADSTDAFDGLERVLAKEERWVDLADVLRRRCEATYSDSERISALERLAEIYATQLQDRHEAVSVYREILTHDPNHQGALDALEMIFEEDAQWHELTEILRNKLHVNTAQDGEALDALQLKLAGVLRRELFEVDEALGLYRTVLARTPGQIDAISAFQELLEDPDYAPRVTDDLIAHLRSQKDYDALIALFETRAAQSYDPGEKAEFFEQIARVYADHLDEPIQAIDAMGQAWKLQPERDDLHEQLLDLVATSTTDTEDGPDQTGWARLAEIYEDILGVVSEPELMLDLHLGLAQLYRDQLEDPPRVEANFREVLALDERHELAYSALEGLLIGQDRWLDFIELLERKFNVYLLDDPREARETLLRIAVAQEEQLDDGFSAVDTFRRALDLDEADPSANRALSRLLRAQERWQDLADHLRRRMALSSDPDQVTQLKQELADLLRTEMADPQAAVELYRQILDDQADHQAALASLETLFDALIDDDSGQVLEPELRAEIAGVIEPIYRHNSDFAKLVDALLARVETADSLEIGNSRLLEAAQISEEQLKDAARATEIVTELFKRSPHDQNIRAQLHRLHTYGGEWAALAELYSDVLANHFEVDDALRVELLCERGALAEERLADLEDARRTYGEVLLFDVDNARAIDAIERLLTRTENWQDLAEFYRDRADITEDPIDSRDWLERLATLYEEVLDELDEAIAVYGRVYDLEPGDHQIQQTLARLYGHAHRWHDLADLYRHRIETSLDPQQTMELRFRLAGLLEGELDLIEDALQIYRDILADAPGHQETLRALEALQRDLSLRDNDRAQYRPQIIDLLLEHYNEKNHWRRIADLLEEKQQLVDDIAGQVSALSEMAELIQRSASEEADKLRALVKLTRAFCIDPSNESLRERVHERAEALDAWERIVPIYLQSLETSDDPEVQASLLIAIAEAYAGPLDDTESAITAYQQAVDINGNARALGQLQRLYGDLELWEPLVRVLRKRLENEYDADARQSLLKRIAMIYDEILDWPDDAIRAYEDLRAEDPGEVSVLNALSRLYRHDERWADLEETLQTMATMVEDEEERGELLLKLAQIQDEKLGSATDAISTYRAVIAENPDDVDTLRALSRLFESSQNWPELLDNLALEAEFAEHDEARNAIDMRIAIVLMDKLSAPMDALAPLSRIVARDPANLDAREVIVELLDTPQTREDAARILQEVYRDQKAFDALKNLYERRLSYLDDAELRAEIFMELAALHEDVFESSQMAFMTLSRAVGELPAVEFIRRDLERLSESLGNTDELAAVYEDTLESATLDPDIELEMRRRTGQLYAAQLGDFPAAIKHYEAALRIDEYDSETLDWLDRLYQQANRWEDLAEILNTRLAVADPDHLNDVRFRLAYLREVVFNEHRDALELYRQIIIEEPEHRGALEGLGRMAGDLELRREICELLEPSYQALEAHEALAELFELKLEVADSAAERAELHRRIAELQIDALGNVYAGYAYLGRAMREDPHDIDVQERLEALAEANDLQEQWVALYEDVIDQLDDPVRAAELALSAADAAADTLEEPARAVRLYQMVLQVEPDHAHALGALERIAREQDEPVALEAVLRKKVDSLFDPDARKKALLELGEVRMRLEMFEEAIQAYREALTLDEGDLEVLHQLVALFEITERYTDLVETLERLAGYIKDADEQRLLYVRIGQYTRHFIDAPERSIAAYQRADALSPDNPEVLSALETLYEQTEKWNELLDIVERQLALIDATDGENPRERLRLYVTRARVNYAQFNRIQEAIEDYQRAFALQKDSPLVVEALDELYRGEQRWEDLMALYREQLQFVSEEARLLDLHVEMADITQSYLDDDTTALELLDMVLQIQPAHPRALNVLQSIYERRGEWTGVVDVLERKANSVAGDEKIAHLLERAAVLEQRLSDTAGAAAALVTVLEVDPAHAEALQKLKALYKANAEYGQLYAILEHEAALVDEEDARVEIMLEMAELARTHLESASMRIDALEKAYALRPANLDIVEPLLDAYIDAEDFARAEPILGEIIATLHQERRMSEVVRFEHLRGKLAEQKGDLAGAQQAYEAAHKVDATYVPNLLSLGKLLVRNESWDDALKIFQTLLLHQMSIEDSAQKVDLYYYLGRVRVQKGDARRAKDMFNRALGINADHTPSKEALAAL